MRIILGLVGLVILAVVAMAVFIRTRSHDAATWHVDPLTAPKPSSPNSYRVGPSSMQVDADDVAPVFDMTAEQLGQTFDAMARDQARVEIVSGSAAEGWVTYVQRSAFFGFPDYISVRFIDVDGGSTSSTLAVFSRSRMGESDLGVNEKRVKSWLAELS